MTTGGIKGFFEGGGRTAKFPNVGSVVSGVITAVHEPEPQTDFETRAPIPGKYQIRVELQTDERDPDIDGDDGKRTLYVKGWMTGAIRDALRAAGADEPAVNGKLVVTRIEDGAPTRPGLQGPHRYSAVYERPAIFAAGGGNGATVVKADAPIPVSPPAGIDPKAWQEMPEPAKQAIANTMAGLAK